MLQALNPADRRAVSLPLLRLLLGTLGMRTARYALEALAIMLSVLLGGYGIPHHAHTAITVLLCDHLSYRVGASAEQGFGAKYPLECEGTVPA